MPIILYDEDMSPPCQSVHVTARALGVPLQIKDMDLFVKMDHKTPEYLKMNPSHTIPTINDDGFCVWESRAIMQYLVQQYGKDDKLYPKEPKKRAVVDTMLQFDLGSVYASFANYFFPPVFGNKTAEDSDAKAKMIDKLQILDGILGGRRYAAGDHLTLADISFMCSLHAPIAFRYDLSPYANILAWRERMKKNDLPFFDELTLKSVEKFTQLVDKLKADKRK